MDSPLSQALRAERKRQYFTQKQLANRAGVSVMTLYRLEHGSGNLSSFGRVLAALQLEVVGSNLPVGAHLGHRLALLRRLRDVSQRQLAAMAGVSVSSIVAIEADSPGRLETLERVLTLLGAGARLAPQGTKRTYHERSVSSVSMGWTTPPMLLEKLYQIVGIFDLDPCSPCSSWRAPVRARMRFTREDDGLSLPWYGTVFMNPPYGKELSRWVAKARDEVTAGRAQVVIALLPVRSSTTWWHRYVVGCADVLMLRGKLNFGFRFGPGSAGAPFASALVVWGGTTELMIKLREKFPDAWYVKA